MDEKILRYSEYFELKDNLYYLVKFYSNRRLVVLHTPFVCAEDAIRSLEENFRINPEDKDKYFPIIGKEARYWKIPFSQKMGLTPYSYKYPKERWESRQKRKTYRTIIRRRIRRMGKKISQGEINRKVEQWIKLQKKNQIVDFEFDKEAVETMIRKRLAEKQYSNHNKL